MVRCGHPDVLAQVARGIANFAKCESRAATQGNVPMLALCVHFAYQGYIYRNTWAQEAGKHKKQENETTRTV